MKELLVQMFSDMRDHYVTVLFVMAAVVSSIFAIQRLKILFRM